MPPASERVRREWLRRVEAEYRSAAITQHLGLWLIQIAAPPELITDSLRIVGDEMTHAELSHAVFVEAGGSGAPHLPRDSLALPRTAAPLEHDVLRAAVDVYCLGETIAVRLFKRLRAGCTVPSARRALDRVLADEVRHRDFGWTLLEWLLSTPLAPELRQLADADLPSMLRRIEKSYAGPTATSNAAAPVATPESTHDFTDADRAWGLMPVADYADAVRETFTRDYAPRFSELGISIDDRSNVSS